MHAFNQRGSRALELEARVEAIAKVNAQYLHGDCHLFAMLLAQTLHRPIAALVVFDGDIQKPALEHAMVFLHEDHSQIAVDIRGMRSLKAICDDFESGHEAELVWMSPIRLLEMAEGTKEITPAIWSRLKQAAPIVSQIAELARLQWADSYHNIPFPGQAAPLAAQETAPRKRRFAA